MANYLLNEQGLKAFEFSVQKQPVFKELKQKDWVLWGYSNDYEDREWNNRQPDYYEWLYNSSSKHRAIINRKCLFIGGKGLETSDKGLTLQEQIELKSFAFKIDDSEIVKKLSLNWLKQGGFSYEVVPTKNGKKIDAYYINFKNLRRSKREYDNQGREKDPTYFYTEDWSSRKPEDNPDFTEFHIWKWGEEPTDKNKRYIVYYSDDDECLYPYPEYTAAVPYIAADYEVGNFVYNNTKNGFTPGWLVQFNNGEPSPDQKAEIVARFKDRLQGSDGDNVTFSFNEDKEQGVEITPLNPNGQDDRYVNLNKQIREEIFSGHTIDPIVVGLKGETGFNNNADEKRVAIEDFQNYYVSGKQQILERHINAIRSFNEIKGEVYIQRLDPIQEIVSEQELAEILTLNERRERAGFEPTEEVVQQQTKQLIVQMSKEEEDNAIIGFLATCGIDDEELEVIESRELFAENIDDAEHKGYEFISGTESALLRLLLSNPNLTPKVLGNLLKISESEVTGMIERLKEVGTINEDGTVAEPPEDEIFVVYKYAERADAPPLKGESRPFCKNLMALSRVKSWELADIKRMRNGTNLDVFTSRGGWYNLPDTSTKVPYCRHIWKQILARRKK